MLLRWWRFLSVVLIVGSHAIAAVGAFRLDQPTLGGFIAALGMASIGYFIVPLMFLKSSVRNSDVLSVQQQQQQRGSSRPFGGIGGPLASPTAASTAAGRPTSITLPDEEALMPPFKGPGAVVVAQVGYTFRTRFVRHHSVIVMCFLVCPLVVVFVSGVVAVLSSRIVAATPALIAALVLRLTAATRLAGAWLAILVYGGVVAVIFTRVLDHPSGDWSDKDSLILDLGLALTPLAAVVAAACQYWALEHSWNVLWMPPAASMDEMISHSHSPLNSPAAINSPTFRTATAAAIAAAAASLHQQHLVKSAASDDEDNAILGSHTSGGAANVPGDLVVSFQQQQQSKSTSSGAVGLLLGGSGGRPSITNHALQAVVPTTTTSVLVRPLVTADSSNTTIQLEDSITNMSFTQPRLPVLVGAPREKQPSEGLLAHKPPQSSIPPSPMATTAIGVDDVPAVGPGAAGNPMEGSKDSGTLAVLPPRGGVGIRNAVSRGSTTAVGGGYSRGGGLDSLATSGLGMATVPTPSTLAVQPSLHASRLPALHSQVHTIHHHSAASLAALTSTASLGVRLFGSLWEYSAGGESITQAAPSSSSFSTGASGALHEGSIMSSSWGAAAGIAVPALSSDEMPLHSSHRRDAPGFSLQASRLSSNPLVRPPSEIGTQLSSISPVASSAASPVPPRYMSASRLAGSRRFTPTPSSTIFASSVNTNTNNAGWGGGPISRSVVMAFVTLRNHKHKQLDASSSHQLNPATATTTTTTSKVMLPGADAFGGVGPGGGVSGQPSGRRQSTLDLIRAQESIVVSQGLEVLLDVVDDVCRTTGGTVLCCSEDSVCVIFGMKAMQTTMTTMGKDAIESAFDAIATMRARIAARITTLAAAASAATQQPEHVFAASAVQARLPSDPVIVSTPNRVLQTLASEKRTGEYLLDRCVMLQCHEPLLDHTLACNAIDRCLTRPVGIVPHTRLPFFQMISRFDSSEFVADEWHLQVERREAMQQDARKLFDAVDYFQQGQIPAAMAVLEGAMVELANGGGTKLTDAAADDAMVEPVSRKLLECFLTDIQCTVTSKSVT